MEKTTKKNPLISVIIPLYNKGPYVERAIRSVLYQSIQDFEIIVVEGGSTDDSLEVVKAFDDPRLLVMHQREKGVSAARNEGVHRAASGFLAFLDADDEWMPGFIETVLRLKDHYPDAGAYFTAVKEKGFHAHKKSHIYSCLPGEEGEGLVENYFHALLHSDPLYYPSCMAIRKSVFLENGGFPLGSAWGEDQDLCGRIAFKNSVAFSSHICTVIHKTDEYANTMLKRIASTQEHPFIKSAQEAIVKGDVPVCMLTDLKTWIQYLILFSVRYNLNAGNPAGARNILKQHKTEGIIRKKTWLEFWSFMPEWTFNIRGYSLFRLCDSGIFYVKNVINNF